MSNAAEARRLLRHHRYGALSTLSKKLGGYPFGSITPYLVDHDGSLVILISALAEHSKNIGHDHRVSLITHNQASPDIQMQGRVTVVGNAHQIEQPPVARYLRHFPDAADLLTLDFTFYRIEPVAIRYIGGVGRVHWITMATYFAEKSEIFAQLEKNMLDHINTQQLDFLREILQMKDVQAAGIDCDGMDVCSGDQFFRIDLPETSSDPGQFERLDTLLAQSASVPP